MKEKEVIELIKLYISTHSDESTSKVKPFLRFLSDIEKGFTFNDLVKLYNLV